MTGSWPVYTECGSRLRANGFCSLSVLCACLMRPRENPEASVRTDDVGTGGGVVDCRSASTPDARLAKKGVVGQTRFFACLGPALEYVSRYSLVERPVARPSPLRIFEQSGRRFQRSLNDLRARRLRIEKIRGGRLCIRHWHGKGKMIQREALDETEEEDESGTGRRNPKSGLRWNTMPSAYRAGLGAIGEAGPSGRKFG